MIWLYIIVYLLRAYLAIYQGGYFHFQSTKNVCHLLKVASWNLEPYIFVHLSYSIKSYYKPFQLDHTF